MPKNLYESLQYELQFSTLIRWIEVVADWIVIIEDWLY